MSSSDSLPLDLSSGTADDGVVPVAEGKGFSVHLVNFEGPFDLLLQLISKHKLDITEIALSQVTDDFIAHIKALGSEWDLDQTSEFRCWRRGICCSRGCCGTARSSRSRR